LENFEPILKVLEQINPEKEYPFFYDSPITSTDKYPDSEEINKYVESIVHIDKTARIWIDFLLQQAVLRAKDEKTETIINNALPTSHNDDIDAIQLLFDEIEDYDKKYISQTYHKRIEELEKFTELNKMILEEYRKEFINTEE